MAQSKWFVSVTDRGRHHGGKDWQASRLNLSAGVGKKKEGRTKISCHKGSRAKLKRRSSSRSIAWNQSLNHKRIGTHARRARRDEKDGEDR